MMTIRDMLTFAECCAREVREETGIIVRPGEEYLEIEELFLNWRHIQHYFLCEYVEDTGIQHLTEAEIKCGNVPKWLPFDEAVEIFGRYEDFHETSIADYGLYRREYMALKHSKILRVKEKHHDEKTKDNKSVCG